MEHSVTNLDGGSLKGVWDLQYDQWQKISKSIEAKAKEMSGKEKDQIDPEWSVKGLTSGICTAVAFASIEHMEKYGHLDPDKIPPLIQSSPSSEMQYTAMLVIKAIYQSIDKNQRYSDLVFNEKNRDQIDRTIGAFQGIISGSKGIKKIDQYPKKDPASSDFSQTVPMSNLRAELLEVLEKAPNNRHCMLFFRKEGTHFSEGHVLYVNFENGIIVDGNGLIWKIPEESKKDLFIKAILHYIKIMGYDKEYDAASGIVMDKEMTTPKEWPLTMRKIALYWNICVDIWKHEGLKQLVIQAPNVVLPAGVLSAASSAAATVTSAVASCLCCGSREKPKPDDKPKST